MRLSKSTGSVGYRDTSEDYAHVSYSKHQPLLSVGWCKSIHFVFLSTVFFYILFRLRSILSFTIFLYVASRNAFLISILDMSHSNMYCEASKMMSLVTPRLTTVWLELTKIRHWCQDPTVFRAQVCTLTTTLRRPCYLKWLRVRCVKNRTIRLSIKERERKLFRYSGVVNGSRYLLSL